MSDDYRDPLVAAQARVEALERENAALKNMQNGRPATAAEVETLRLENEVLRLDTQWQARTAGRAANASPKKIRGRQNLALVLCTVLFAGQFAALSPALFRGGMASAIAGAMLAVFASLFGLVFIATMRTGTKLKKESAQYEKKRARLVEEIAKLGVAQVRVAIEEPRVAEIDDEFNAEANGKQAKR